MTAKRPLDGRTPSSLSRLRTLSWLDQRDHIDLD